MFRPAPILAALALVIGGLLALALRGDAAPAARPGAESAAIPVDVELVLAVDISYSMDPDEQALQREGYVQALTSREFPARCEGGHARKMRGHLFEWAGSTEHAGHRAVATDRRRESADAFAAESPTLPTAAARRPHSIPGRAFFPALFETSRLSGARRVIDVSGDGTNNNGQRCHARARDEVFSKGMTINGLPIMLKAADALRGYRSSRRLFEECVDRRAGRLRRAVRERSKFIEAIAPSCCWKSPRMITQRTSSQPPPTSRGFPAPSANASGRNGGGINANIPGAAQHAVMRCRPGTVPICDGPGSAVYRFALHGVRDTGQRSNRPTISTCAA